MQFAMILSGPLAVAPAPRIPAVPSVTGIGLWDSAAREIWQVDREAALAALPAKLRRHAKRDGITPWFDRDSKIENGRCVGGVLPFCHIRDGRGALLATAYFAPVCEQGAGA